MLTIYEHHAYHIFDSVNQVTTGFEGDFILRGKFTGRPAKITKKPKYDHDDQNSLFSGSQNVKHAPRNAERKRQADQSQSGRDIGMPPEVANPRRKADCEQNFQLFCESYFPETFSLPWSPDHIKAIEKIESAVLSG